VAGQGNHLDVGTDHAAVSALCPDRWTRTFVVNLHQGELAYALPGHEAQALSVSPTVPGSSAKNRPTWSGPAGRLGHHPRGVGLHSGGMRVPGPTPLAVPDWSRPGVWVVLAAQW
jgi:hypothetical protein